MLKSMISSIATGMASGGTIDGDITITGDLKVEGNAGVTYSEIVESSQESVANFVGSNANRAWIGIDSTATGGDQWLLMSSANSGTSTGGAGAFAIVNNDTSVVPLTISSAGAVSISSSSIASIERTSSETNTVRGSLYIKHTTDGNMADNFGSAVSFQIKDSAGTDNDIAHIFAQRDGADNSGALLFKTISSGTANSAMKISANGLVTITNGAAGLNIVNTGNLTAFHIPSSSNYQIGTQTNDKMSFWTNNSHVMTMAADGDVMIGTTTSSGGKLTVYEAGGAYLYLQNSTTGTGSEGISIQAYEDDGYIANYSGSAGKLIFTVNNASTTTMVLDNNSKISLANNDGGTGNTIFGYGTGGTVQSGSNYNVLMGWDVANQGLNGGTFNVSIGTNSSRGLTSGDYNTAVGSNALYAITTGSDNVAIGRSAGASITEGLYNVAIGGYALDAITVQSNNVAIGYQAGTALNHTDSNGSVLIGLQAGKDQTTAVSTFIGCRAGAEADATTTNAVYNTYVGYESGRFLDDGTYNTALGHQAMRSADADGQAGDRNVAVGYNALQGLTDGGHNTALGSHAGDALTTGNYNVAIGNDALSASQTGSSNIAIGWQAMYGSNHTDADGTIAIGTRALEALSSGQYNTVIGHVAGVAISTGDKNTLLGYQALYQATGTSDTTCVGYQSGYYATGSYNTYIGNMAGKSANGANGSWNVAVGDNALLSLTTGNKNIAIGYQAADAMTTGVQNVAIGYQAMTTNTTGYGNVGIGERSLNSLNSSDDTTTEATYNTAVGRTSGFALTTGERNTLLGAGSGQGINEGDMNTFIGAYAGENITTGSNNIALGHHINMSAVNVTNEIVIGSGAGINDDFEGGGTDTIRIGRAAEYMQGDLTSNTWAHGSDKRIKKDIKDSDLGLSFIKDLRPVTYKKKAPSEYPKEFKGYNKNDTKASNKKHYGFIAQEVKEAMDKAEHSDFTMWSEASDGMQELSEATLVVPLIKAVQELSAKVKQLKEQLEDK